MSEINQVEVLIKPQVPKVIDNQQLLVYIPTATITSVSNDFEIDYGKLKLKNPNIAYTNMNNVFSKMQVFESNAMFDSGFSKIGGYDFTLPDKSGTIALTSDIVSDSGLVDDVQVNGVSVVENKVANIVVDTELNGQSSNPVANSLLAKQSTALGTNIFNHVNNKTNPHNVTAAQIGLGNVNTELAAVERDLSTHTKDTDNPHNVTAAQVGLGNVNNTSDANKPVSTVQQAALDKKIDKSGGTFSGNVAIQGNLTVSGTTTTESEKQLAVKENVIVTNADKANLQTLLSGLAINKNSTATYGIMYDPADDTVKFGEGTLDANRKFVFKAGEGHPLAIRADSSQFTDAVLVKWNATKMAFEPASGTWQNLLDKIEITDIDLTLGDETVLYDTTNGIQLSATGKITRKDGTFEQPQVDLDIPLVPGKGISIDKKANEEKVEVKIDETANLKGKSLIAELVSGGVTQSTKLNYNGYIIITNPAGTKTFPIPWNYGAGTLLTDKYVKTLFGNKSIVGTGNIDLYLHNIKFQSSTNIIVMFTVISSKNVIVDSLTDLKTLLGNTFEYPVSGTAQGTPIMAINQTGYSTVYDYYKGDWITYPAGTWTDDVKTV